MSKSNNRVGAGHMPPPTTARRPEGGPADKRRPTDREVALLGTHRGQLALAGCLLEREARRRPVGPFPYESEWRAEICEACGGEGRLPVLTGYDPRTGDPLGWWQPCSACNGTGVQEVLYEPDET